MENTSVSRFIETIIIGVTGGYLFSLADLPLPWVLGSLTFVMLWQGISKRKAYLPDRIKNTGLIILGIYFGLYFTAQTFLTIGPYFLPYLIVTGVLIAASILISTFISQWINVDRITSVFGSIPGGLTEMVIASESLKANPSLVIIFQTVRLLTVLFIVPAAIIFYFNAQGRSAGDMVTQEAFVFGGWNYLWFILPIIGGMLIRDKIPAGYIIAPLALTALMNVSVIELAAVPYVLLIAGQVAIGTALGKKISFQDLKLGGKYCFVYFGVTLALIIISLGLGILLAHFTTLNLATAILSVAPGGLIEMVLTASVVGGDPAVVSALQLVRILVIIILIPPFLKWYFKRIDRQREAKYT